MWKYEHYITRKKKTSAQSLLKMMQDHMLSIDRKVDNANTNKQNKSKKQDSPREENNQGEILKVLLNAKEKDIKNKATKYTNEINGIKKTLKATMDTGSI